MNFRIILTFLKNSKKLNGKNLNDIIMYCSIKNNPNTYIKMK